MIAPGPVGPAAVVPAELAVPGCLLAVDQTTEELRAVLVAARVPASARYAELLRRLALTAPGLGRTAAVVVRRPEDVYRCTRRTRFGVRMRGEREEHDEFGTAVERHRVAGARFARWRLIAGTGVPFVQLRARAARAGRWAACCQRGGLTPFVECAVRCGEREGFAEAGRTHAAVVGTVIEALAEHDVVLGATLFGVTPVVPGRRARDAPVPQDVALATMQSLRTAGAIDIGAFAFRPADGHASGIVAQVTAMQWMCPTHTAGVCLGRSVLTTVARVWRGDPRRIVDAQRYLVNRLTTTTASLRAARREIRRCRGPCIPSRAESCRIASDQNQDR